MKGQQTRSDLLIGATLVTASMVLSHALSLPLWTFAAFLLAGVVLAGEAVATTHTDQAAARYERWLVVQAKAPQLSRQPDTMRKDAWNLIRAWAGGAPTTKRFAADNYGIPEARWREIVDLAVKLHLGQLQTGQGGNQVLRMHATNSLNHTLNVLQENGYSAA